MLQELTVELRRHKRLADAALAELDDRQFFERPAPHVNSPALIVKHVAGNLRSRWTDFLTTDGEKPDRNRDGEFEIGSGESRERIMTAWTGGWNALWDSLKALSPADVERVVLIRGEPHTVQQAVLRTLTHTAYHVGQILYVVRFLKPDGKWLTISPGESQAYSGRYFASDAAAKS